MVAHHTTGTRHNKACCYYKYERTHTHTHTHIYIFISLSLSLSLSLYTHTHTHKSLWITGICSWSNVHMENPQEDGNSWENTEDGPVLMVFP